MQKVIVTGGRGFIGKRLVQLLLDQGIGVTLLISGRKGAGDDALSKQIRIVEYQEGRPDLMAEQLGNGYDVFYHLAWGGVDKSNKNSLDIQFHNLSYSLECMKICKAVNAGLFVGAGTVAEYVFEEGAIDATKKQTPNDLYGASKVAAHYLLEAFAKSIGQPFIWTVLPSTFGEGREEENILTYTICKLLAKEKPCFGNLEQMWDFLYISDVVNALFLIGEKGRAGRTYGIGSGIYRPLKNYITEIRDYIDPLLPLGIGEIKEYSNMTKSSCVSIAELQRDTGFKPLVSFPEGIRKTVEWYRERMDYDAKK